jgi:hypothetical protein
MLVHTTARPQDSSTSYPLHTALFRTKSRPHIKRLNPHLPAPAHHYLSNPATLRLWFDRVRTYYVHVCRTTPSLSGSPSTLVPAWA